jgi:hypothetical protein
MLRKIVHSLAAGSDSTERRQHQLRLIPGKPLICTIAPVFCIDPSPGHAWGQVRLDLPEQLLASGLTWYWWYKSPPFQRLTSPNASNLIANLQSWLESRQPDTTELCGLDPTIDRTPTQEDAVAFLQHGTGPIRILVHQVGDKGTEDLYVTPTVLSNAVLRELLGSWNVVVPANLFNAHEQDQHS